MRNNNIDKHISDAAYSVSIDPTNTPFASNVTDLQSALDGLGSQALDGGLNYATTSESGLILLATESDIDDGTDTSKAVTPSLLSYALDQPNATETNVGWTRYATDTESLNTTFDTAATTPKNVHYIFDNRNADQTTYGTVRFSSSAQATGGTDNTTATTPLRVKEMIDTFTDTVATATESVSGSVELATVTETSAGTIRDGFAISPYTFARANASESNFGTARVATQSETNALSSDTRVITPLKLNGLNASTTQKGLVELATDNEAFSKNRNDLAVTPANLDFLNATTNDKGLVELAGTQEAKDLTDSSRVITPAALNAVRATATDESQFGLTRLSNTLFSSSQTSALSSYGASQLRQRVDDLENDIQGWEEYYNAGTGRSSSSVMYVPKGDIDGYEYAIVYINNANTVWNVGGFYSSKFNNGNINGLSNEGSFYNYSLQRFELPASEDKFIVIMRRRIPWL
tara:strand:+ start:2632 stop:4020 length:1389 start_codon:yes stop_codon:yes gene_type:complete